MLADTNGGIQQFLGRIGLAFGQIQVDKQLRIALGQRRQQRQDIGFADGGQTADTQRALRHIVPRSQFGTDVGDIRQQRACSRLQPFARIRQHQTPRRADKQRGVQRVFQRINVAYQRRRHHSQLASGGGEAAQQGHLEKYRQMFNIAGVIHLCIICKSVSYEYQVLRPSQCGYSFFGLTESDGMP
ncbi:hypothetical protein D3C72_1740650 [compost metagenome]